MQPLQPASKQECLARTSEALLDTIPPVLWFIRRQMRTNRRDLSLPQFRALCCINHEPNVSLSVVADFLGASLPTTSRIVSGLVKKGLIERSGCHDDRRQVSLHLTDAGRSIIAESRTGTQEQMAIEIGQLTQQQRRTVTEAMHILRDVFGSAGFYLGAKRESAESGAGSTLDSSLLDSSLEPVDAE